MFDLFVIDAVEISLKLPKVVKTDIFNTRLSKRPYYLHFFLKWVTYVSWEIIQILCDSEEKF